jgi:hypothetical protein
LCRAASLLTKNFAAPTALRSYKKHTHPFTQDIALRRKKHHDFS